MSPNSPALHKAGEAQQTETARPEAPPAPLPPIRRLRVPEERPGDDPEVSRKAQGRRLLAARLKSEYRTASEAARALGIAGPTYLAHENGTRQIRPDIAAFYARKFGVSTDWLLYNTGEMTVAGAPKPAAAARATAESRAATEQSGGLARLLLELRVSCAADGSFAKLDESGRPGQLPPVNLTDGYIPELTVPHGDPSECLVALSDRDDSPLALRATLCIPTDMIECARLFAVKLPSNSLLREMPGGQRVYLDPDDHEADDEGLFIVSPSPRLLVPAYVRRSRRNDQLEVTRSLTREAALVPRAELRVLGRVVLQLRPYSEIDLHALAKAVMAPVN